MKVLTNFIHLFFNPFNFFQLKINHIKHSKIKIRGLMIVINKGNCEIKEGCIINSSRFRNIIGGDIRFNIIVHKSGNLFIGKNFKGSNSTIVCRKSIYIGENVMLGGSCKIWDNDFHPLDPVKRINDPNNNYNAKPIKIGNNVFIGGSTLILKGSIIGNNSVIGAGSVVSGNIPANEIWAGNPARFVRKLFQD